MKRLFVGLLVCSLGIGMGGCGLFSGPDNYESYKNMYSEFAQSKTARGNAMAATTCPEDQVAAAYCNSMKVLGQAFVSLEKFDITAPKTGYDVLYKATDSIVPVAGFYSLYKLGVSGITNAGSKFGDNATVTNSLNHTEANPTNIGSGSTGAATSSSDPSSIPATDSYNVLNPVE